MEHVVICDNPRLIVNPAFADLIDLHHTYYVNGRRMNVHDVCLNFRLKKARPKDYKIPAPMKSHLAIKFGKVERIEDKLDDEFVEKSYIVNEETGETWPLYIEVGCGHCPNCRKTKVNAFVHRCKLETYCYPCMPIFLTLTYSDENLPAHGVEVRHVQLFFKRLRINLERAGYTRKLRYFVVAEYGKNTHRAHYHALLWNLHATKTLSHFQIKEIIAKSWNMGYHLQRYVNVSNDRCFYYTSKYLKKDCQVPPGCNNTFRCASNRGGGIGCPLLDKVSGYVRKTLSTSAKVRPLFSDRSESLQMNKYALDRIFPSFYRSVSSDFRRKLKSFVVHASVDCSLTPKLVEYMQVFKKWIPQCFLPVYTEMARREPPEFSPSECMKICDKYLTFDFDFAHELSIKRNIFLNRFFRERSAPSSDFILNRSKQAQREFERSYSLEQL